MKISGTCLISKKPSIEFSKTNDGADIVKGNLFWADPQSKSKRDELKTYSSVWFVAFGEEMSNFFRDNYDKIIEIKDCPLKRNSWKDKDGNWREKYEIIVFNASVYEKKIPPQSFHEPKESESNFNAGLDDNNDIPF